MTGRRQPYTERGISRVPCARCGEPSSQQWQICALSNRWLGVCDYCDFALNQVVLAFMKHAISDDQRSELLSAYAVK